MIMKIQILSRESIRPSLPTSSHLNTYSVSLLDQLCPPPYVPLLLYYTKQLDGGVSCNLEDEESSSRHRCDVLKKSLAETLTKYYPLAGRIKDDHVSVECNDEGVDYIEARVVGREESQVIQLTDSVNIDVMEPFLPFEPYGESGSTFGLGLDLVSKALLKIQVNVFYCGGIIICSYIFPRIADGTTFVNFIKDWAATARGGGGGGSCTQEVAEMGKPRYELSSLFPPRALLGFNVNEMIETEKGIVTKRFVFKALNIGNLKKKCIHDAKAAYEGAEQEQQLLTRFEALTLLIWKCFMDVDRQTKARRQHEDVVSASVDAPVGILQQ